MYPYKKVIVYKINKSFFYIVYNKFKKYRGKIMKKILFLIIISSLSGCVEYEQPPAPINQVQIISIPVKKPVSESIPLPERPHNITTSYVNSQEQNNSVVIISPDQEQSSPPDQTINSYQDQNQNEVQNLNNVQNTAPVSQTPQTPVGSFDNPIKFDPNAPQQTQSQPSVTNKSINVAPGISIEKPNNINE